MHIGDGFSREPYNTYLLEKIQTLSKGDFMANVQTNCVSFFFLKICFLVIDIFVAHSFDDCLYPVFYFWPNGDFSLLAFMYYIKRQTS